MMETFGFKKNARLICGTSNLSVSYQGTDEDVNPESEKGNSLLSWYKTRDSYQENN